MDHLNLWVVIAIVFITNIALLFLGYYLFIKKIRVLNADIEQVDQAVGILFNRDLGIKILMLFSLETNLRKAVENEDYLVANELSKHISVLKKDIDNQYKNLK
jgi:hypothetical protein